MATSTRAIPTTPAEFPAWESRQGQRYELAGGVARAMRGNEGWNGSLNSKMCCHSS